MKTIITAFVLIATTSAGFADTSIIKKLRIAQVSISCGIAPIPPIGCRVGACVCDQFHQNCQWTFVCH